MSKFRKAAGIKYPQGSQPSHPFAVESDGFLAYAEQKEVEASADALKFNCAQRAHQNTLESIPIIYATYASTICCPTVPSNLGLRTLVAALTFPKIAAAACTSWSVARAFYTACVLCAIFLFDTADLSSTEVM